MHPTAAAPNRRARRLPRCLTCAIAIVVALGAASPPAVAQGTSGMVPDPVGARELTGYADRLGLSDQQRLAIEGFHRAYQERFAALREADIAEFLDQASSTRRMLMDPSAIDELVGEYEKIIRRIRTLDEQLFDQMQSVLTEDQLLRLPRARLARERTRLDSGLARAMSFLNPAANVDLSELVIDLSLSHDAGEAIDPILQRYETSLTSRMRDLNTTTIDELRATAERLAGLDMAEMAFADEERRREIMQLMQRVWSDLSSALTEGSMSISELNRTTVPRLQPLMEAAAAYDLHRSFYRRGYREFADAPNPAVRRYARALDLEAIDPSRRADVEALRDALYRDLYRVDGAAADAIDARRRVQQRFGFGGDGDAEREARRAHEATLDDLREQRKAINARAIAALDALLGPELTASLPDAGDGDGAEDGSVSISAVLTSPGGDIVRIEARNAADAPGPAEADPFLPGPITADDVERYARVLGLDEVKRTVLGTLHDDYEAAFRAGPGATIAAVERQQRSLWTFEEGRGMTPPTEAQVEGLYTKRRSALREVLAADAAFFEDVAALTTDDQAERMERVRLSRERDVYNRPRGAESFAMRGGARFSSASFGGSRESAIDLERLLASVEDEAGADARPPAVETALTAYARSVTEAFRTLYTKDMAFQETMDKLNARNSAARAEGEQRSRGWGDAYRATLEREGGEVRSARERVVTVNRATLDELVEALGPDGGTALARAYERRAVPGVFEDARSAAPVLTAALELPDLAADQRSEIASMAATFNGEHEALSRRIAAITMERGRDGNGRNWQARIESQRRIEAIRAERDDLSERVRVRLRALLTDEQLQRVEGVAP